MRPEDIEAEYSTYAKGAEAKLKAEEPEITKLNNIIEKLKGRSDIRAKQERQDAKEKLKKINEEATAERNYATAEIDARQEQLVEDAKKRAIDNGLDEKYADTFAKELSITLGSPSLIKKYKGKTVTQIYDDILKKHLPSYQAKDYTLQPQKEYVAAERKKIEGGLVNEGLFTQSKIDEHRKKVSEILSAGNIPYRGWQEDYPELAKKGEAVSEKPVKTEVEAPKPVEGEGRGKPATITVPGVGKAETQYTIGEAGDILTSHTESFEENPEYPQEYQPRDRSKIASAAQATDILNNLHPEMLGESVTPDTGTPRYKMINGKPTALTGNIREWVLKQGYATNHPKMKEYKQWLVDNAEKFGLDPAKIQAMKAPVLRREVLMCLRSCCVAPCS